MMTNYNGEKILIIGLGITGLSCINFFLDRNIHPRVMDTRSNPPCLDNIPIYIEHYLGGFNKKWVLESTLIVVSPGVSLLNPELIFAKKAGIEIIGDIELFFREIRDKVPLVTITGTNGKSTVTSMLEQMCICAGWKVGVGGNIGIPALNLLKSSYQLYILELSSFQLETTYSLYSSATTILNISEDHIDRYPLGIEQYRSSKLKIYQNSKVCIVNIDDLLTFPVDSEKEDEYSIVSFGIKNNSSDYGLMVINNETWLMAYNKPILNCAEMNISGIHNYSNSLAALALAEVVDIPYSARLVALKNFIGLSHRFELVYECNDIRWINDSKSTNVGSTLAALNGLHIAGTLHLLIGGDSKSINFSPLLSIVQQNYINIYCFGKDRKKISIFLHNKDVTFTETLEQAVHIIYQKLVKGDIVLLSPACSSLDQFSNFKIRGELFTYLAKKFFLYNQI